MLSRQVTIALFLASIPAAPAWGSVIVSFDPTPTYATVGQTFDVRIVANIPASEAVVGWGLDYIFGTPGIVVQQGFTIGSSWDPAPGTPDGDGLGGLAPMPEINGVWGTDITLVTLHLQAMASGQTTLIASDSNPPDLTEGFAIDPSLGGGFADVVYNTGLIIVPEPATAGLIGLAGLPLLRRRRR
jgi:hypothetical protein